jgi:nucleoside-triphosphatase THEP1
MTVTEILEQVKKLSPKERDELLIQLQMLQTPPALEASSETSQHWGKNLIRLLDEIGPVEIKYSEIEDPVEWVKQLRRDERKQRLGNWGDDE